MASFLRLSGLKPSFLLIVFAAGSLLAGVSLAPDAMVPGAGAATKDVACPSNESGLKLPAGFCATIFADNIGHSRHLAVSPSGVVYVNTWSGRYFPNSPAPPGGFLIALQDQKGTGHADVIQRFGETAQTGGAGGTGIRLYDGWVYAEINDRIVRYALPEGQLVPQGGPKTILSGLPLNGDHPMHPFIIQDGFLYVDVATATNACQPQNRTLQTPGMNPCDELLTRGGVWRYDASKMDQKFSPAERYATGIRNAEGFAIDTVHHQMFVTQHGRDQLHSLWPKLYTDEEEATLPSEELLLLKQGGDYGWPECYYDPGRKSLVLAPEYGGDGKTAGVCANKTGPYDAFPAHWAPNDLTFYDQKQFPARYRDGVFIAFHGSWNRAPYQQQGYNVVFQSLADGPNAGRCEIFADGFAGTDASPGGAAHRPTGLAVGPDGSLFVADDVTGRIYKIVYRGDPNQSAADVKYTPCPSLTAGPGAAATAAASSSDTTANLPVPAGATREMVAQGEQLYHGSGGATCVGCHGANAKGTPLGPDLTDKIWLWSDGSFPGIAKTITQGVTTPKQYRAPMPALGGSQLTPEQVSQVSAYIWALSHGN
jgi:glucose/arabinose dehydrogenase/mono/diheme cytochrome c family protein